MKPLPHETPDIGADGHATQDGVEELCAAVKKALARHPILKGTTVVARVDDLPDEVQQELAHHQLPSERVSGVFASGSTYVIGANLASIEDGLRAALHEAVGHHGVRALLGEHFEPVMLDLYESFPREHEAWGVTAQRYGYLDTGTEAGRVAFAEELTAHMAEQDVDVSEFDMIHAEVRASMRELVPDLPMTDTDVRALIQRTRESLIRRHGDPEAADEVRQRQAERSIAASRVMESQAERGVHTPDPLSLALYREGSQVVDNRGLPCRLYHGSPQDVQNIGGPFWGTTTPQSADDYIAGLAPGLEGGVVIPYYADIKRPFDGDQLESMETTFLRPDGLTIGAFMEELVRQSQSGHDSVLATNLRDMGEAIERGARRDIRGPTYYPHNFWYKTEDFFGPEGARLLQQAFDDAGFDGIRYTEGGDLTYGAFRPSQLHFLDQGASPRGWQPDRHHGDGPMTERPAFKQWFGDSRITTPEGEPRVMYHATTRDITAFESGANELRFSSSPATEPAFPEKRGIMPVYLSIQNPAPSAVVQEAYARLKPPSQWHTSSRSPHDEVRQQLQSLGYDGFLQESTRHVTPDEQERYRRTGEASMRVSGGAMHRLCREYAPVEQLENVTLHQPGVEVATPEGALTFSLEKKSDVELLGHVFKARGDKLQAADSWLEVLEQAEALAKGHISEAVLDGTPARRVAIPYTAQQLEPTGESKEVLSVYDDNDKLVERHDGGMEALLAQCQSHVAVAFAPEQVKSAIGNRGTFLQNHPDIRFSLRDVPREEPPQEPALKAPEEDSPTDLSITTAPGACPSL